MGGLRVGRAGSERLGRSALWILALAAGCALVAALAVGSVQLDWAELFSAGANGSPSASVLMQLRLPRAVSGFAVGGLLALAGAVLQTLLRNPLADPYVLGVSGGASVAALLALTLWGATLPLWGVQVAAGLGAAITMLVLFALARASFLAKELDAAGAADVQVLLTGVMLAAIFGAMMSVLLALAGDGALRGMVFWLLGDLSGAVDLRLGVAGCVLLLLCTGLASRLAPAMNVMMHGQAQALTQGVDVPRTRAVLIALAALATGYAVSVAGAIGFVGFVAPHWVRWWVGHDQRRVLPAAALAGGTLVVLADTLGRSVLAPVQLPVGVVTALVGAPVFLCLMRARR